MPRIFSSAEPDPQLTWTAMIQNVIGALGLATSDELSANNNAPLGEGDLFADLHHPIPACPLYRRAYKLGADIALAEIFLVHKVRRVCLSTTPLMPGSGRTGNMESSQHLCTAS